MYMLGAIERLLRRKQDELERGDLESEFIVNEFASALESARSSRAPILARLKLILNTVMTRTNLVSSVSKCAARTELTLTAQSPSGA